MSRGGQDLFYVAAGGGLGHLSRALAFARAHPSDRIVVCDSARDGAVLPLPSNVMRLPVPSGVRAEPAGWPVWLGRTIDALRPRAVVTDAFPLGLFGEWAQVRLPPGTERMHVARRLKWAGYREAVPGPLPRYARCWRVEPLEPAQDAALAGCSDRVETLVLPDATPTHADALARRALRAAVGAAPAWLVVHSGPASEVRALIEFARSQALHATGARPAIVLAHPDPALPTPPGVVRLALQPAVRLFPWVDRIYSGCGFNVMREAAPWRARHRWLPFERRYDDQFERARRIAAEQTKAASDT